MKKRRSLTALLAVVLCVGLFGLMPASAAPLYFTAVNDSVTHLTADTMPCWSGGTLYVPYTVFNPRMNGIGVGLGLDTSYNRSSNTVTIFNLKQMLVFDLNNGTCRDELTKTDYGSRAIMRNGKPYVAVSTVCSVFGMEYSYNQLSYITQGYLVRIKGADTVLDDATFIDAARRLINDRLREYTQSLSPAETATPAVPANPTVPGGDGDGEGGDVTAYLAFRCQSAQGLPAILNALDEAGHYAVFFLTPEVIREEGDLIRRMLGTGHSVGILADEGEQARLEEGRLALEELANTRTTLACVPEGAQQALEERGWVCWKETMLLEVTDTVSAAGFANAVLNRLGTRRRVVYLSMEGGDNTARVLPALLRQLSSGHYSVAVPMETKL